MNPNSSTLRAEAPVTTTECRSATKNTVSGVQLSQVSQQEDALLRKKPVGYTDSDVGIEKKNDVQLRCFPGQVFSRAGYRHEYYETLAKFHGGRVRMRAFDGLVDEATYREPDAEIYNYNHHNSNDLPGTPSASMQNFIEILSTEEDDDNIVEINDVGDGDPDCALSFYMRSRAKIIRKWRDSSDPYDKACFERIKALVELEDYIDCHAGLCKLDLQDPTVKKMAWIFEEYFEKRPQGLFQMSASDMEGLIRWMCVRIDEYVAGNGQELDLDMRCQGLEGVTCTEDVAILDESRSGPYARIQMVNDNKRLIVNVRRNGEKYVYTIVMAGSDVVSLQDQPYYYDLERVYAELNVQCKETTGCWGGRWNAGGSPRMGTHQLPQEIVDVIARWRLPVKNSQ